MNLERRACRALIVVLFALLTTACGRVSAPAAASPSAPGELASVDPAAGRRCLFDGSEAFEQLTENAQAGVISQLEAEAVSAKAKAAQCKPYLSEQQSIDLDRISDRVSAFSDNHDRTALALAAVEGYRILVSAQTRGVGDTPLEVALLDYAGFRFQAGAHAATPLWVDMRQALTVADEAWRGVGPRVGDAKLNADFGAQLEAMRAALEASDTLAAQRAVATELDQVDLLEAYFAQHPAD